MAGEEALSISTWAVATVCRALSLDNVRHTSLCWEKWLTSGKISLLRNVDVSVS